MNNVLTTPRELKEVANIYHKCINLDGLKFLKSPSLKYALYNLNLFEAFNKRNESLKTEVQKLREKLKNYQGDKINTNKEIIMLNDIYDKLITFERQAKDVFNFYSAYLGKIAKKYDTIKDDTVKNIYYSTINKFIIILNNINHNFYLIVYNFLRNFPN